jgi:periplasmic protein TonB
MLVVLEILLAGTALEAQQPQGEATTAGEHGNPAPLPQPTRVRLSSDAASKLRLRKRVYPIYPRKAREDGIQGTVFLNVIIDKEGNVADVSVVSGEPSLAEAATKAAKQCKYKPYLLQGKPVEIETTLQISFTLN